MLMDKRQEFRPTVVSPGACEVYNREAWQAGRAQLLEATRIYANMFATSGVNMISYNAHLAECVMALSNGAFTFGYELRRINNLSDFIHQSNNYTENWLNALHRYNAKFVQSADKAMDEIAKPAKTNAILAYGVVR